jgi:hypothetical protein
MSQSLNIDIRGSAMISNTNRSGAVATEPESDERRSGRDVRSGRIRDKSSKDQSDTLKILTDSKIRVKDGRLLVEQSPRAK